MTFPPEPQVNEPTEPIRERRLGLGFWLPMGWIILIVGAALLAPVLPLKDPTD